MEFIKSLQQYVSEEISKSDVPTAPSNLYDPIRYIMDLGGKRMRPVLTLLGHHLFDDNYKESISAALSVELFHNFTLVHDDIMDDAPKRRSGVSVHRKWNNNVAILSGDALLIMAYQKLQHVPRNVGKILALFNQTALEICEGQQRDIAFEEMANVSIEDYKEMIRLKTAVLLGCSLKMGALIGGAPDEDADKIYTFGEHLGIAFQLRDDHLDVYAKGDEFGKQIGGDIQANKKTFLLLSALERAKNGQKEALLATMEMDNPQEKISQVTSIFDELEIASVSAKEMEYHYNLAYQALDDIKSVPEERKIHLRALGEYLMNREV